MTDQQLENRFRDLEKKLDDIRSLMSQILDRLDREAH